jgi:hypothetical protein
LKLQGFSTKGIAGDLSAAVPPRAWWAEALIPLD